MLDCSPVSDIASDKIQAIISNRLRFFNGLPLGDIILLNTIASWDYAAICPIDLLPANHKPPDYNLHVAALAIAEIGELQNDVKFTPG